MWPPAFWSRTEPLCPGNHCYHLSLKPGSFLCQLTSGLHNTASAFRPSPLAPALVSPCPVLTVLCRVLSPHSCRTPLGGPLLLDANSLTWQKEPSSLGPFCSSLPSFHRHSPACSLPPLWPCRSYSLFVSFSEKCSPGPFYTYSPLAPHLFFWLIPGSLSLARLEELLMDLG